MATLAVLPCPKCTQKLRVPTDRGALKIKCPKCRHEWILEPSGTFGTSSDHTIFSVNSMGETAKAPAEASSNQPVSSEASARSAQSTEQSRTHETVKQRKSGVWKRIRSIVLRPRWKKIATHDPDAHVRSNAVTRIKNKRILFEIARRDENEGVRALATSRLTNEAELQEIARTDEHWTVRQAAIATWRIRNPAFLDEIIRNDNRRDVRLAAEIMKDKLAVEPQ